MKFFDYTSLQDEVTHGLTLIERSIPIIILTTLIFILIKNRNRIIKYKYEPLIRYSIGILMLMGELAFITWNFVHSLDGEVRFIETVPLQLCSYAIFGMMYAIVFLDKKVYNYVFIFAVVSFLAYLFPNLNHGFNSFRYYQLYFSHGLLMIALFYLSKVHGFYPNKKEFIHSFIFLQLIIFYSILLNIILQTDYLFIGPGNKPIDFAWNWPWHMIQYELFFIIMYYIFYRIGNQKKR